MAIAFLNHYQHNKDLAPDKSSLRVLTPNKNEKFRAFAQRWRNLAAQITPPMTEKELIDEFMTLSCLDDKIRTACAIASTFPQLVTAGLRIEAGQESVFKSSEELVKAKKKDKEVHNISGANNFKQSVYQVPGRYHATVHYQTPQQNNQYQNRPAGHVNQTYQIQQ